MRGPAADEGAEWNADTGNAAEAPMEAVGMGMHPSRPSTWGTIIRTQGKAWKQRGGRQRRHLGPFDLGNALLPPSLGAVVRKEAARGMWPRQLE